MYFELISLLLLLLISNILPFYICIIFDIVSFTTLKTIFKYRSLFLVVVVVVVVVGRTRFLSYL